jgi:hypothetical protein
MPIHTDKGLVPIEKIKVGDKVLSFNEQTKQFEYKTVAHTFIGTKENLVHIKIKGEKRLTTTTEHPFYVKKTHKARDALSSDDADDEDGEWVEAGSLKVGDRVLRSNGKWTRITRIEYEQKQITVYNFEVEGNHSYFVGNVGVLSHNCGIVGSFTSKDVALGVHEFLGAFKGSAQIGSDFKVTTTLIDAIKNGIDSVVSNGGKIRFNLDGFDPSAAMNPASEFFNTYTSQEFRYVMQNYRNQTVFYRNGQIVADPF